MPLAGEKWTQYQGCGQEEPFGCFRSTEPWAQSTWFEHHAMPEPGHITTNHRHSAGFIAGVRKFGPDVPGYLISDSAVGG